MTDQHDPAHAMFVRYDNGDIKAVGLTALEHACIALRVPGDGLPTWLYELIVEARRMDMAQAAMAAAIGGPDGHLVPSRIATSAAAHADAFVDELVDP